MSRLAAEILTIDGPDALAFAQAQFASDVRRLEVGQWQWTAWLNAQGRVRACGQLLRPAGTRLRLLLRGGRASDVAAALQAYVLRKRVTLAAEAPATLADAPLAPAGSMQADGDAIVLGMGAYAMRIAPGRDELPQDWRAHAIRAGHPWLPDAALGTLLAPALALGQLGAVDLGKGCFPGQEIVARLHYRGGCKQQLRRIESRAPLVGGDPLRLDGKRLGLVLDAVTVDGRTLALAVVRATLSQGPLAVTVNGASHNIRTFSDLHA